MVMTTRLRTCILLGIYSTFVMSYHLLVASHQFGDFASFSACDDENDGFSRQVVGGGCVQ